MLACDVFGHAGDGEGDLPVHGRPRRTLMPRSGGGEPLEVVKAQAGPQGPGTAGAGLVKRVLAREETVKALLDEAGRSGA